MSSGRRASASGQRPSGTRRVIIRSSQPRSAWASASALRRSGRSLAFTDPEHHVVLEDELVGERADVDAQRPAARRDPDQADHAWPAPSPASPRPPAPARRCTRRLTSGSRLAARVADRAAVVAGALARPRPASAVACAVEKVARGAALDAEHGGEEADRPAPVTSTRSDGPARLLRDALDLLPRLGHNARRLREHADRAERRVEPDRVVPLDGDQLGAVAVELLDPASR